MSEALPVTDALRPGQVLAAAREEQKLSLADVSQQIKYGVNQIQAIEADDYARLPGATFVRGMIRSYAKLVHVDAEPLLRGLNPRELSPPAKVDLTGGVDEPFVEGGRKSNRVYGVLSMIALSAVALLIYEWQLSPAENVEVVTITPRGGSGDGTEAAPAPAAAGTLEPAAAAPLPAMPDPTPGATQEAGPVQAAMPSTAPVAGEPARASGYKRIELVFDDLSWVQIKQTDGKVLLSQLNQAGTSKVIEGTPPFELVIGNAAKVRMKYEDAPVDLRPYFKIDVARLKLE